MTKQTEVKFDWEYIKNIILNGSVEHAVNTVTEENYIDRKGHYIIALDLAEILQISLDLAEILQQDAADLPDECVMLIPLLKAENHYTIMNNEITETDGLQFAKHLLEQIDNPHPDTSMLLNIINDALELYSKALYGE